MASVRPTPGSSTPVADAAPRRTSVLWMIGAYELLGGVVGLMTMLWIGLRYPRALPGQDLSVSLLPFGALMFAGLWLIREPRRSQAPSALLQLAQIVGISTHGFVWKFSAGLYASITLLGDRMNLFAGWDTSLLLGLQARGQPFAFSLNVVPICLLIAMWRFRRKLAPGGTNPG